MKEEVEVITEAVIGQVESEEEWEETNQSSEEGGVTPVDRWVWFSSWKVQSERSVLIRGLFLSG